MLQQLKLSTKIKKRLKMSCCGQLKWLWHSCFGQPFLLMLVLKAPQDNAILIQME